MDFKKISIHYTDTDSLSVHKKYWSDLVDKGYTGKFHDSGENDYGNSGILYGWFLAPKIK